MTHLKGTIKENLIKELFVRCCQVWGTPRKYDVTSTKYDVTPGGLTVQQQQEAFIKSTSKGKGCEVWEQLPDPE